MVDSILGLSQIKSLVQAISGDTKGARKTQENFLNKQLGFSQCKSAIQAISGDMKGAKETQEEFAKGMNKFANNIPVVGYVKGGIHYAVGDEKGGDEAIDDCNHATIRTAGVLGGATVGLAGGPAGAIGGAIAGGAAADGLLTGIDSAVAKEFQPSGIIKAGKAIHDDPKDAGKYVDALGIIGMDAVAGALVAASAAKSSKAVETSGVEAPVAEVPAGGAQRPNIVIEAPAGRAGPNVVIEAPAGGGPNIVIEAPAGGRPGPNIVVEAPAGGGQGPNIIVPSNNSTSVPSLSSSLHLSQLSEASIAVSEISAASAIHLMDPFVFLNANDNAGIPRNQFYPPHDEQKGQLEKVKHIDMRTKNCVNIVQFDPVFCGSNYQLSEGNTKVSKLRGSTQNSMYLRQVVDKGIHKWRFKIAKKVDTYTMVIGVWKDKYQKSLLQDLPDSGAQGKFYGWHPSHYDTTSGDNDFNKDYGDRRCQEGDIIDMILDLNKYQLSYNLNDKPQGIAFENITRCGYTVGVYMFEKGDAMQLLSHEYH